MKNQLTKKQYYRCLELFAIIHEEIGEAQKSFNDYVWKDKGVSTYIEDELRQIDSPIKELIGIIDKVVKK